MRAHYTIATFSLGLFLLQSCSMQQNVYFDDVYAVKTTEAEMLEELSLNQSDTLLTGQSEDYLVASHDFSVNERLRDNHLYGFGQRQYSYYHQTGRYFNAFRYYRGIDGKIVYIEQGFSSFNPFINFYGWNGITYVNQWNFLGMTRTPSSPIMGESGNYSPGSITSSGLYLRGPRGSISGIAGVTSRGSSSYKSTTVTNTPSTGRTPVNVSTKTPARNTAPVVNKKPEVKPAAPNNPSVNKPARREPTHSMRRPNSGMDRPINRGNAAPSRGTGSPQGGSVRGGNSSIRTNGRP